MLGLKRCLGGLSAPIVPVGDVGSVLVTHRAAPGNPRQIFCSREGLTCMWVVHTQIDKTYIYID